MNYNCSYSTVSRLVSWIQTLPGVRLNDTSYPVQDGKPAVLECTLDNPTDFTYDPDVIWYNALNGSIIKSGIETGKRTPSH